MSKERKLSEYKVSDFLMTDVDLTLDLTKESAQSTAIINFAPNPKAQSQATELRLDFENMTLESISLDDKLLASDEYELKDNTLIIKKVPQGQPFKIKTTTQLGKNTDLFGLYELDFGLIRGRRGKTAVSKKNNYMKKFDQLDEFIRLK